MTMTLALWLVLIIPVAATVLILMSAGKPNQREAVTILSALALFANVLWITGEVLSGTPGEITFLTMLPGLDIAFRIEPLGLLFGLVASGLWIINSLYSIGYMRGNREKHQTRFYACFPIAIGGALGIAYSANLATMFLFYEVLTLSTWPLVAHKQNEDAKAGARVYLGVLIATSIGLFLPAIIWTWTLAGTVDFRLGGILAGHVEGVALIALLALFMFGIGKAALMPMHRWLPSAMVAPTPVSALLHAVAVVKAGVFSVLKVMVYIFGTDFMAETGASEWLVYAAAGSLTLASLIAMRKDNLKARLAYSTVSQLSYVTLGAALATSLGVVGAALQIAMHAMGKITLFFGAGAIYTAHHKTEISEMDGLGRRMPFTYGAMLIGALSIIGLPPLGGVWAKWYLMSGAVDAQMLWVAGILMLSSLLNVAYLLPIIARGFFKPAKELPGSAPKGEGLAEAPAFCVVPLCLTALGCVVLFFMAGDIIDLIAPIAGMQ